jgi:cellobiose-specific phosphotransferase system component IIC
VSPLSLRPTRGHVLPALVVLFPAEWFVLRSVGTAAVRDGPVPVGELVVGSLLALVAAYVASVVAVSVARTRNPGGVVGTALNPSDRTLAVLGVVLAGAGGYLLASLFVTATGPLGTGLAAVGLLFGLPLVLAYTASVAVTNALGVGGIGTIAVVVGLAASALWTFGLAAVVGDLLGRLGGSERAGADGRRDGRTR